MVCRGVVDVKGKGNMTTYWVRDRAQVLEHRAHLAKYRKRHSQADIRSFHDEAEEPSRGGAESLCNMGGGGDSGGVDNLKWGRQRKEGLSRKKSTSFFNWFKDSGGSKMPQHKIHLEGDGLTAITEDARTSELYWPTPTPLSRPQRNVT